MNQELINKLSVLAERKVWDLSEGEVEDYAGGNINYAYNAGYNDGQTDLAKALLDIITQ